MAWPTLRNICTNCTLDVTFKVSVFRTYRRHSTILMVWPWSAEPISWWWRVTTGLTTGTSSPSSPPPTTATGAGTRPPSWSWTTPSNTPSSSLTRHRGGTDCKQMWTFLPRLFFFVGEESRMWPGEHRITFCRDKTTGQGGHERTLFYRKCQVGWDQLSIETIISRSNWGGGLSLTVSCHLKYWELPS